MLKIKLNEVYEVSDEGSVKLSDGSTLEREQFITIAEAFKNCKGKLVMGQYIADLNIMKIILEKRLEKKSVIIIPINSYTQGFIFDHDIFVINKRTGAWAHTLVQLLESLETLRGDYKFTEASAAIISERLNKSVMINDIGYRVERHGSDVYLYNTSNSELIHKSPFLFFTFKEFGDDTYEIGSALVTKTVKDILIGMANDLFDYVQPEVKQYTIYFNQLNIGRLGSIHDHFRKIKEEQKEFISSIIKDEPKARKISEFWDSFRSKMSLLDREGITVEEVFEGSGIHMEKVIDRGYKIK